MLCYAIIGKIEMKNDQTGLTLSEMSILARTLENITKYSNKCADIESASAPSMLRSRYQDS